MVTPNQRQQQHAPHNYQNRNNTSCLKTSTVLFLTILSTIILWEQIGPGRCGGGDNNDLIAKNQQKRKDPFTYSSPPSSSSSSSYFEKATETIFDTLLHDKKKGSSSSSSSSSAIKRRAPVQFQLSSWKSRTDGGLTDPDRRLLAKIYGEANSVFEYGLGESTYLANYLQVPRYAGTDSSIEWVDMVKKKVSTHFRFYFADVGDTLGWGVPADPDVPKTVWQYQLAPLQSELQPFDVYMVDGRWRTACVLASFLHASSRGAKHSETIVLLHDCIQPKYSTPDQILEPTRKNYTANDDILDLVDHSRSRLCVYKRKPTTTDAMIWERYMKYKNDAN